eukprot:04417_5
MAFANQTTSSRVRCDRPMRHTIRFKKTGTKKSISPNQKVLKSRSVNHSSNDQTLATNPHTVFSNRCFLLSTQNTNQPSNTSAQLRLNQHCQRMKFNASTTLFIRWRTVLVTMTTITSTNTNTNTNTNITNTNNTINTSNNNNNNNTTMMNSRLV